MEPQCSECNEMFEGCATWQEFIERRHTPDMFADVTPGGLKYHLDFIDKVGTAEGSCLLQVQDYHNRLAPSLSEDEMAVLQSVYERAMLSAAGARVLLHKLELARVFYPDDAVLNDELRHQVVCLLEIWHSQHGRILWLLHIAQMGPEHTSRFVADARDFPEPLLLAI